MSRRLEFEPELYSQINRSRRRVRQGAFVSRVLIALAMCSAGAAVIAALSGFLFGDNAAIDHMAAAFLDGLQRGSLEQALALCAEAPAAGAALEAEASRVSAKTPSAPGAPFSKPAMSPAERLDMLATMREDLTELGVDWTDVKPIAFGGARAGVRRPALMKDAATVVIGDVYFQSNGSVFTVELSAWKCGRAYVIADIWQWGKVEVDPQGVRARSRASCASLKRELAQDGGGNAVIGALRSVFVRL